MSKLLKSLVREELSIIVEGRLQEDPGDLSIFGQRLFGLQYTRGGKKINKNTLGLNPNYGIILRGDNMQHTPATIGEADLARITVLIDNFSGYDPLLLAQHGLSILLEVSSGGIVKRILFDTGPSADPVLHNMGILNIRPDSIDMVVLSHSHQDHTSGLVGILGKAGRVLPVIGHPQLFRETVKTRPFLSFGGTSRENSPGEIIGHNGRILLTSNPLPLMGGVITTGEVERRGGFKAPNAEVYNIINGELLPDTVPDDISVIINIKGKGLVIITGCSHAGIVNILRHAVRITGISSIYGVIGGFHLVDEDEEKMRTIIAELMEMNLKMIIPGHCTGFRAISAIAQNFNGIFKLLHSGMTIDL